jgi:hypothetical protein
MGDVLILAGSSNPVLTDYAMHCLRHGRNIRVIGEPRVGAVEWDPADRVAGMVIFLDGRLTRQDRDLFDTVRTAVRKHGADRICVVSTFRVHLGDRAAVRCEAVLLAQLRDLPVRVSIVRPAHVLSRHSRLGRFLRHSWYWFPLLPGQLRGCCVDGDELFAAIDRELAGSGPRRGTTYTLLGVNQPWRDRLLGASNCTWARTYAAVARVLLPLAIWRYLAGLIIPLLAARSAQFKAWHTETMRPRSLRELLALYNKYNYRHVQIAGYNNGVVHFGQRFPGKTVVSTVRCNHRARLHGEIAEFDTGVTIRQAMDLLGPLGRELHVLPNYSYVSLGTAFFIPIHGSASKFTTIAETIEKVILYDPVEDCFIAAKREDPPFGRFVYNLKARVLLLRLRMQTKEKSRYYVKHLQATNPSSREILGYFHDNRPSNVEVRKAGSAARTVTVYQYYTQPPDETGAVLDLPRDAIGRVWDRLEENLFTSWLFHSLTRRLGYHVELFLPEAEFATFWETHAALPILKIQLRFIRRDGLPHSPFRQHDCIAADLFLLKKHRARFERYLKETLPTVQMNPGKQTM